MTPLPRRAEITEYGLPHRIGGWVHAEATAASAVVKAILDGKEVGAAPLDTALDGEGRRLFSIAFPDPMPLGLIATGRLRFLLSPLDGPPEPIPCWEVLTGVDAIAIGMATITHWKTVVGDHFASIAATLPRMFPERITPLFPSDPPTTARTPGEFVAREGGSPVHLPVGLASADGEIVLGRKGFVFLTRGRNAVLDRYVIPDDDPVLLARADAWKTLVAGRVASATARGLGFVQTIVPDKVSVLADYLPADIVLKTPTPLLAAVEERLRPAALRGHYLSALTTSMAGEDRAQMFRRVDNHLTPFGAFRLAREIVRQMGYPVAVREVFHRAVFDGADLGARFLDVPVLDQLYEAVPSGPQPIKIDEGVPDPGRKRGRFQIWHNEGAPIPKRLLVFGNAFSNLADSGQGALSFWLARWFTDFHFVWNPSCEWSYIDHAAPDIVLCQTTERFLDAIPET